VLIESGSVRREGLAKELLAEVEPRTVAQRQGFSSLKEVESCVLEPGGTFAMRGVQPDAEERRHEELIARLNLMQLQPTKLQRQNTNRRKRRLNTSTRLISNDLPPVS